MIGKKLMLLIIAGVITTSPVYAIAHSDGDSDEMRGAITKSLQGVSEDVEHGSIKVGEDMPEEQRLRLATIGC